jgi:hypothetical protein
MTESTSDLNVRIKFATPSASGSRQEPRSEYRWDRILLAAGALVLVVALAVKMLLPAPAPEEIVEPVKRSAPEEVPEPVKRTTPEEISEPVNLATAGKAIVAPDPLAGESDIAARSVTQAVNGPSSLADTPEPQATVQDSVQRAPVSTADPQTAQGADSEPTSPVRVAVITPGETRILSGAVQRFVLTNAVKANEPVGGPNDITRDQTGNGVIKLFAYSQVTQLAGEKLIYRWLRGTTVVADVEVKVRSENWRSYASKYLSKDMRGPWRVELRTGEGELLAFTEFEY